MIKQTILVATVAVVLGGCSEGTETAEDDVNSSPQNDPLQNGQGQNTESDPTTSDSNTAGGYLQFNDSPYASIDFSGGYFYLEDFEDGVLEHPGATADNGDFTTISFGPTSHDSVDADDGLIDGNSLDGESWFYKSARIGVKWTFDAAQLDNLLPTHVGIVWTDGKGEITFEAFDAGGNSISVQTGNHADDSFEGGTAEDRFYGVVHSAGIGSIHLRSESRNGIEMDHLQWGYLPVSE